MIPFACRLWRLMALVIFFHYELVVSSLKVARAVVMPGLHIRPGILRIPLDATSDLQITVLGNLISLTPGSLTLDVSADRRALFVHAMFIGDPDDERRALKTGMERKVVEALP